MNFLQKLLEDIRFSMFPLSKEAHSMWLKICRGEVTNLEQLTMDDVPAIAELLGRKMIIVYEIGKPSDGDPKRPGEKRTG